MITLALIFSAAAQIAPECVAAAAGPAPEGYSEEGQQNFLLNYFALSTTFSAEHAPVPADPGHGSLGVDLNFIPALGCERRLVLGRSKTEDTNKTPVAPRIRATFAFPKLGPVHLYAGLAYIPPVTVFGTRNVIASGEIGAGIPLDSGPQFGLRYHYTLMKTVAEIATPVEPGGETYKDFFMGSTYGVDAMGGFRIGPVTPYVAAGFTTVSTFFWIGDDGVESNNTNPYNGFTGSLGAQFTWKWVDAAAEFYTAPGYLYTGRVRLAYAF